MPQPGLLEDTGMVAAPTSVLVVDDHAGFRRQACMLLEEAGYAVVGEADDAASAVEAAQRFSPDAILLDIQLPDADGFCVLEALAHHPCGPLVVLISGRDEADYASRIASCGAHGFISKSELSVDALHRAFESERTM
jgi:DNA-binding NarL/FixJ family response regulator